VNPVTQAVLASWTLRPGIVAILLLIGGVYARGFHHVCIQMPERFPRWRLAAFAAGLATLWLAIASPLDAFSGLLLQVHMIQHLLLMFVAPPLLLLGAPALPLLRGLPRRFAKDGLGPFLAWPALQRFAHALTHPLVGWLALTAATWGWHIPAAYQLALRAPGWHALEHGCFVAAALLFWWPVILPWPSRAHWPRWTMVPYLLLADVQNTIFSAFFTFSDRLIYPFYANVPRLGGGTPLDDQVAAGAIMWVPASLVFLIPGALIMLRMLSPQRVVGTPLPRFQSHPLVPPLLEREGGTIRSESPLFFPRGWKMSSVPAMLTARLRARSVLETSAFRRTLDLLTLPGIGRLFRWPYFRRTAQVVTLGLAAAVVTDGLLGPQMSPMNLAGIIPWTYWRGFTVMALLAAGNLFCLACPFMLPREWGRRLGFARHSWPQRLRSKWLAVGLLIAFLWAYEIFDLWDSPWWTAWLILAYFAGALVVDTLFAGASFCKYVCPIGQFQFIQSMLSPFEVRVRAPQVCASCTTHDCLRGNPHHRGCELELFLPRKVGNLDCTFCLDCIHACPHDNIGILTVLPGSDLLHDAQRSSLGRLSRRADVTALALVLVFGAFTSAAAMVAPVTAWQHGVAGRLGLASAKPVMGVMLLLALVIAPLMVTGLAVLAGRVAAVPEARAGELRRRFTLALIPLGLAMWAAHFLFHLVSGFGAAIPVVQRVVTDLGSRLTAAPRWMSSGSTPDLVGLELLLLDAGLLLSLYVGWRIASAAVTRARAAFALAAPWAIIAVALYLGGVWTFLQPMQMRGMMMHATATTK